MNGTDLPKVRQFRPETLSSRPSLSRITHVPSVALLAKEDDASRIRAITFDVGGTLIHPWPSVGHVYAAVAARHDLADLPIDVLNRQFAGAWKNVTQFHYTRAEWSQLVNESFLGLVETPLNEALFADLYSHFGRAEAWRIFDDVVPTLESLRSGRL